MSKKIWSLFDHNQQKKHDPIFLCNSQSSTYKSYHESFEMVSLIRSCSETNLTSLKSSSVLTLNVMSRPQKQQIPVAKKVLPPAVPQEFRHSGSSFGSSTGYASSDDAVFLLTTDIPQKDEQCDFDGKSPLQHHMFTYPVSSNAKPMAYYQHHLHTQQQQDDLGIDVTQSPGRDSPGSSNGSAGSGSASGSRHSTASLDSGRASYHHHHHHSSTGGSSSSTTTSSSSGSSGRGLAASSPRCSLSSCSISSSSETNRIEKMIAQGIPDHEVIQNWLSDLQFEEYALLFISAGYDMQTICRMTPEDLTAIGIQNPTHRKKLKSEIALLTLLDNLPDYIPDSIEEWLCLLKLDEYEQAIKSQGYNTVEEVTQLTWEDLEDIGIVKLGHQKKIMLAIKRVKDIRSGKRFSCIINNNHKLFNEQCHIQGERGKSLESLDESIGDQHLVSHRTFIPHLNSDNNYLYQQSAAANLWRNHHPHQRSFDDGDLTPTNEPISATVTFEVATNGGGTLPRPRGLVKPRPVAKISANKSHVYFDNFKEQQQQFDIFLAKKLSPVPISTQRQNEQITIAEVHNELHPQLHNQKNPQANLIKSTLPLPAYPSSESLSLINLDSHVDSFHDEDLVDSRLPPPPAPSTPPNCSLYGSNRSWNSEEKELMTTLLMQHRNNGSDASFKSSSSTESDSLPFANDNAGTIKNRSNQTRPSSAIDFSATSNSANSTLQRQYRNHSQSFQSSSTTLNNLTNNTNNESVDVLHDIGNMLANLTDELDAMLENEKRQQQQQHDN